MLNEAWPYVTSVSCGSFNKPQMFVEAETLKKASVLFKTILQAQLTDVLTGNGLQLEKRGSLFSTFQLFCLVRTIESPKR